MTAARAYSNRRDVTAMKPFRLVKVFSFSALVLFLVSTITLAWLIVDHTRNMLLQRSEAYAMVLAENLNHQVFQQFVLPVLVRYGKIGLRNPEQFKRLDYIVQNTIHGLHLQSVTIFDREEGIVSYSTIRERVGKKGLGGVEYRMALQGRNNSRFIVHGNILDLLAGNHHISFRLKTYIPFRQEERLSQSTGPIMGVFEIVQDLSGAFKALLKLQMAIIGGAVVIMAVLFIILWLIVARGDKIIMQRAREWRRLEEKLNHAERLAGLGKMVASVSHEIKNPLGIIQSTAGILGKRLRKLAPGNERLADIIVEETARLDGIVREFLDFARPQKMKLLPLQANELLSRAADFMEAEFAKNKITLINKLTIRLPLVNADVERLYQALLNIMVNAVQAMPHGGCLTIGTREEADDMVVLEIGDTGVGMTAEVGRQALNPFFTSKNRGTGLGLAIVNNIVTAHHGRLEFASSPGKGTTFMIKLPL
ncbi:MAG: two-component sensor histidine kinase, partial [Deltaproteobacteria bacterium]|nr:two-component sensor histidine kinase [Deltaproteobacteria bacterium]